MSIPKFVIDLDTGVDDAMALLMALHAHKRKDIQILAITTVNGNAGIENVVRNTFRTMETVGCSDIPVYKGASSPIVMKYDISDYQFHGSDGFNDVKFDWEPDVSKVQTESANQALHKLAHKYPGEITLVCLGPLTNIALAFRTDATIPSKLKNVFIMGGNMEGVGNVSMAAEFNFHADPEAAFIVLDSVQCPTVIVTWEMCFKYVKPEMKWRKSVLGMIATPEAKLMNALEQVWFDSYEFDADHWIMCDQFIMIAALDSSTITDSRDVKATVELAGYHSRGNMILEQRHFMVTKPDFKPNVTLVLKMDQEKVKEHLLKGFGC